MQTHRYTGTYEQKIFVNVQQMAQKKYFGNLKKLDDSHLRTTDEETIYSGNQRQSSMKKGWADGFLIVQEFLSTTRCLPPSFTPFVRDTVYARNRHIIGTAGVESIKIGNRKLANCIGREITAVSAELARHNGNRCLSQNAFSFLIRQDFVAPTPLPLRVASISDSSFLA